MIKSGVVYLPLLLILFLINCGSIQPELNGTDPIDHKLFDDLLSEHVDLNGSVNYKGFQNDSVIFRHYLDILRNNSPNSEKWDEHEKLAYWINAYNAFTIELILKHYPLKSIKDIGYSIQIPFVNTPWDIKFIEIAGEKLDLNKIEHSILRKEFDEPRIHFAIVCASTSCPNLRPEAYEAERLEEQLNEQAYLFLNDSTKNKLVGDKIKLSKIFNWFKGDFTKKGSLIDFLNKYSKQSISRDVKISHMDYDWSINE